MKRSVRCLTLFAVNLLGSTVMAQQAPPNSGQLLQQVPPSPSVTPSRQTPLTIEAPSTAAAQDTKPFEVRQIVIEGNTAFSTATLHALVAEAEGHTQTLSSLQVLGQLITIYYRDHGFPLARASIPAQTVSAGVVRIRVVEAHYGQVQIENHTHVSDRLLQSTLAPLRAGSDVEQSSLDRSLLLLNDLPGVQGHSLLRPGTQPGTSDLVVDAQALPRVTGNLTLDDAGDRYTGRARLTGNVAVNNLAGIGDDLNLQVLSSNEHMRYGRLGYDVAASGFGTRVGVAYSALDYRLSDGLSDLDAHGTATGGSAWVSQALVRGPDTNLNVRLEMDQHRLHDEVESTDLHNDRHTWDWTLGATFDHRDGWNGVTVAQVSVTEGQLGFDNALARIDDMGTADVQGRYLHWNGNLSRLQSLAEHTRLYLALSGQYSHQNLDSSEQFLLGGAQSVRGYDVSTLAGAAGYLATAELRQDLPMPGGHWQGSVFVDDGGVWINPDRWVGLTGANHAALTSAGAGVNWSGSDQWSAQVQVGQPVGGTPDLAGRRPSTRIWAQITKGF